MLLLTWSSPVSVVVVTRLLCSRVGEPWDECLCYAAPDMVESSVGGCGNQTTM